MAPRYYGQYLSIWRRAERQLAICPRRRSVDWPGTGYTVTSGMRRGRRRLRQALIIVGVWTAVGSFPGVNQSFIADRVRGHTHPFATYAVANFFSVWLWALYTPIILWLARRWRLTHTTVVTALLVHVPPPSFSSRWSRRSPSPDPTAASSLTPSQRTFLDAVSYAAVVLIAYSSDDRRAVRAPPHQTARLGATAHGSTARCALRRAAAAPLLFNTLNAAAELRALGTLMPPMRCSHGSRPRCVACSTARTVGATRFRCVELALLDAYVGIIRARFGDRIDITVCAAPETLDIRVPTLILQPLVENAVRHGIEPRAARGAIHVDVRGERRARDGRPR